MSTLIAVEAVFTSAEVAKAAGKEEIDLRTIEEAIAGWGSPRHWRMCRTGALLYTAKGVEEFARHFRHYGNEVAAKSLDVMLAQRQTTPSRDLIPPGPKNEPPPRWMNRPGMA